MITPSVNLHAFLRTEGIGACCEVFTSQNRVVFSTSAGGMDREVRCSIYWANLLGIGSAACTKPSGFCVAGQYQAPSLRRILAIFTG